MKTLLDMGKMALAVVAGGWILGIVLDEAGKGKGGKLFQDLATKATNGFGK